MEQRGGRGRGVRVTSVRGLCVQGRGRAGLRGGQEQTAERPGRKGQVQSRLWQRGFAAPPWGPERGPSLGRRTIAALSVSRQCRGLFSSSTDRRGRRGSGLGRRQDTPFPAAPGSRCPPPWGTAPTSCPCRSGVEEGERIKRERCGAACACV